MKEKLTKNNQSVEKALQIIEVMAKNKGPMRLSDISTEVGLPSSTIIRFLSSLMSYNYVNQNKETLKYSLSLKFCHIANMVSSQISLRDVTRPFLLELSEKCEESVCLAIVEDLMMMYIDVVDGPDNMLKTMQRIGKRAPLHSTGVGKLILQEFDSTEIDKFIQKRGLPSLTPNTITTKDVLVEELIKIKQQGYALDNEECELGARCIAAPLRDYTGRIIACISISGPISRVTGEKMIEIQETVIEYSNRISQSLGYHK